MTSRSGAQEASGHPNSNTGALDASHSMHRAFRCLLSVSSPELTRREQRTGPFVLGVLSAQQIDQRLHWAHQVQHASPDAANRSPGTSALRLRYPSQQRCLHRTQSVHLRAHRHVTIDAP